MGRRCCVMASQQTIAAVRRFNRFYTRQIGVLRKNYLDSPYSLGEMRVLYELAQNEKLTASDIDRTQQEQIVSAMKSIETLLAGTPAVNSVSRPTYTFREPRAGDFGWIVSSHAKLYLREYGWAEPFEGLCAQIVADFVNNFDPERERCWIVEMNGENVGCVMLVKDDQPNVARLRLLLVDPKARGLGLGAKLVDECVRFARAKGYAKIT